MSTWNNLQNFITLFCSRWVVDDFQVAFKLSSQDLESGLSQYDGQVQLAEVLLPCNCLLSSHQGPHILTIGLLCNVVIKTQSTLEILQTCNVL